MINTKLTTVKESDLALKILNKLSSIGLTKENLSNAKHYKNIKETFGVAPNTLINILSSGVPEGQPIRTIRKLYLKLGFNSIMLGE